MLVHWDRALRLPGCVVAIGAFDGVHRGHQALLRRVLERASRLNVPSVAYTFEPPPKSYFRGTPVLTCLSEKVERLQALGLTHTVVARFDADYAACSPEEFLEELSGLNPVEAWVGAGFRFGCGQAGDVGVLATRFPTRTVEPVRCGRGAVISSSRVRALLAQGATGEARSLLGWSA
jgi:riboflavin kinase/FMN adenylyltransferase